MIPREIEQETAGNGRFARCGGHKSPRNSTYVLLIGQSRRL